MKNNKGGVTSVTALHTWIYNAASIPVETLVLTPVLEKHASQKKKTKESALTALIIFSFYHLACSGSNPFQPPDKQNKG